MNEKAFRAEVAEWMAAHLTGEFACLRHRGGPGDEEAFPALRKTWEQVVASGGWVGLSWPEAHAGRELPLSLQLAFHEEYVRAGGPGRMGHIGETLLAPTLIALGTPEQQRRFLPGIRAGREFWCQGYSEPGAGSDLAAITTRCWQESDGTWRLRGQKVWTSLAHESDWIFVLARSTPGSVAREGLTFLLVPLAQHGIEIQPIRQMTGEAEFNAVFFDGATTDAGCVVGAPGDGWRVAMALLGFERGASTLGQQMHFIHELQLVVDAARANGAARDPVVRQRIADAWIGLEGLRHNATRMLSGAESSRPRPETLIYKYAWSNWHRELGQLAMDVLGAAGDLRSDDDVVRRLQQVFFFSRADTIYAGTNEIQLNIIAERALSMPR